MYIIKITAPRIACHLANPVIIKAKVAIIASNEFGPFQGVSFFIFYSWNGHGIRPSYSRLMREDYGAAGGIIILLADWGSRGYRKTCATREVSSGCYTRNKSKMHAFI